jgi:DNA adenine methylase
VKHNFNNFRKYNQRIFTWEDQVRLRDALFSARNRGAVIVLSNANHVSIRKLYRGFGHIVKAHRSSVLAASPLARGKTSELMIFGGVAD